MTKTDDIRKIMVYCKNETMQKVRIHKGIKRFS